MRSSTALITAAVLVLAGCGGDDNGTTKTVDDAALENGITQSLPSLDISKVSCPSDVPVTDNVSVNCTITLDNGVTGKVKATRHDRNDYTYSLIPGSVKVPGTVVAKSLEEDIAQQGYPNAQVTCPETIAVKVGTSSTCDVKGAGGNAAGTVTYTFSSETGDVDSSSVEVD